MGTASAIRGHVSTGRRISSAWSAAGTLSRWWAAVLAAVACGAAIDAGRHLDDPTLHPVGAAALIAVVVLTGSAAIVDLHEHRIPNRLLSWSAGAVVAAAVWVAATDGFGARGRHRLAAVAAGALAAGVPMMVVRLQRGLGMGDVKLAVVLGGAAGLVHPLLAAATVFGASLSAGLYGVLRHRTRLALGPWLWGAWAFSITAALTHLALGGRF
jgi:leader peptidase (prepilin peptidase)/N-methyltransferase